MIQVSVDIINKLYSLNGEQRERYLMNMLKSEGFKILYDLASDFNENNEHYEDKFNECDSEVLDVELETGI